MKTLRGKPAAKVLAWVLCLAGLAIGTVCAGQAMWLANQGAYQSQGGQMLLEQGEEELAQSYLEQAIVAYQAYLSDGISMEQSMDLDRNNAFYTVKDPQGNAILASDELGDYREKATWTGTIQGPRTEESVTRNYDSPTAREQGLEELEKTYDEFVLEQFTDLAPYDEMTTQEGTATSIQGSYLLEGYGVNYGKSETVEIAVYLRANLTPGGEVYTKLTYLSQMGYYRVELAVAAVVGLALGVLGLALLIRGAGYGPKTPEGGGGAPRRPVSASGPAGRAGGGDPALLERRHGPGGLCHHHDPPGGHPAHLGLPGPAGRRPAVRPAPEAGGDLAGKPALAAHRPAGETGRPKAVGSAGPHGSPAAPVLAGGPGLCGAVLL